MYEVKVEKGTWRRHAHQLRPDKSQYIDFDMPNLSPEDSESSESTDQSTSEVITRRYPMRDRKPTARFGFSS